MGFVKDTEVLLTVDSENNTTCNHDFNYLKNMIERFTEDIFLCKLGSYGNIKFVAKCLTVWSMDENEYNLLFYVPNFTGGYKTVLLSVNLSTKSIVYDVSTSPK